ncbi:MAG: pyruvate, phosphate dikinase, partial [Candidatus Marsarchaeota archaeon]|nr:pyruvate, phosphate dikinase [Candidatus Marsarchaeota archaeon]
MPVEVYMFEEAAGLNLSKSELGGKGYGLVEMTKLGLPVPPGIVITTNMCNEFFKRGGKLWPELEAAILAKVSELERRTGKRFGDETSPLLVSVRSGAPVSMPGMMDTVLNLGINERVTAVLARKTGDERFAYDTYRRFIQLFGKIVMGIPGEKFDAVLEKHKQAKGAKSDMDVDAAGWREVAKQYNELIKREAGKPVPQDPKEQLLMAVGAVFGSWWNKRAIEYRKIYKVPDSLGTAVNIVTMVYGNLDDKSGTGVAFTRDPSSGARELYGEFLMRAQGEDVVAGIRTPEPVERLNKELPNAYKELVSTAEKLERHFRDMQDIEFTVEAGKLYMLQTRNGKRTANAAVKIAIDMVAEGLITKEEAVLRVEPEQLQRLLYKQIDPKAKAEPMLKGLAAAPGAAAGRIVFTNEEAKAASERHEKVILVRPETTPEDIVGIASSNGVLTSRGGMTSHAAVVTRGMGKPCIVGAESAKISVEHGTLVVGDKTIKKGDVITIDGGSGLVFEGEMPLVEPRMSADVTELLSWADGFRRLGVRANADTPEMARKARENGASGIGLDRTERMFNAPDRLAIIQKMILAETREEREGYLAKLKPMQKSDFKAIFREMEGLPVTIRLLDVPLHEFLPKLEEILPEVTEMRIRGADKAKLADKERILRRVMELKEYNPMMGQRGVRLSLMYPEIYMMQAGAIFEAAAELKKEERIDVEPQIMISQVAEAEEMGRARAIVEAQAAEVAKSTGVKLKYEVGSMIETPRAALTAPMIAKYADFFSFGTNDLTQATFAFSRDDVESKFMPFYLDNKLLQNNPFETLDQSGVGRLVAMAASEGKDANPKLHVGICGEHGGDPRSIEFFNSTRIDYVAWVR